MSFSEKIPEDLWITEGEWQELIEKEASLILFSDFENFEPQTKYANTAILLKSDGEKAARLKLWQGNIHIYYDRINSELVVLLAKVAHKLNANFLINETLEYPKSKVIAAKKRLAKKSKELEIEYQKESFGGNNIWLAIRFSLEGVKEFYNLKGEEKSWAEALANMHACEGMFMYEFRGWTFIAGQETDILFGCQVKGEKAIEKCHVDKLLEWGKTFNDIQLFMHYDRSMYFNAFYRVLNGEMVYGEYETESYHKKYGKMPKNLKDLPDCDANTVAMEWSYEPDYLRYQKELEGAKAWVVNIEGENK